MINNVMTRLTGLNRHFVVLLGTMFVILLSIPSVYIMAMVSEVEYTLFLFGISVVSPVLLAPITLYLVIHFMKRMRYYQDQLSTAIEENRKQEVVLYEQARLASIGEMVSMIAHQWRQPLAVISTVTLNLKLATELDGLSQEKLLKSLKDIENTTQHLSKTIDDFRYFYKTSSEFKACNIQKSIQNSIDMVKDVFHANGGIVIETSFQTECKLVTNESLLQQILMSLLSNARDAIIENSSQNPKITVTLTENDKTVVLGVEDTGGGVEDDIMQRIFDPYFSTKGLNGTGLGLHIARTIVESQLGGSISVENMHSGAKFTVVLPKDK